MGRRGRGSTPAGIAPGSLVFGGAVRIERSGGTGFPGKVADAQAAGKAGKAGRPRKGI